MASPPTGPIDGPTVIPPAGPVPEEGRNDLLQDIDTAWRSAYDQANIWRRNYYCVRSALIILAALTSAKAVGAIDVLGPMQAVFALAVTIIAAFDTWLKPGQVWRIHYQYNDAYAELINDLKLCSTNEPERSVCIRVLNERFKSLNQKYREALA